MTHGTDAPTNWPDWIDYHARMFGFRPEDAPMLGLWVRQYMHEGFEVAELVRASNRLALFGAPPWRGQHVDALAKAVRELRKEAAALARQREAKPEHPLGKCALCDSSGVVIVPHPQTLYGKTALWYTLAVTCRCALGCWLARDYDAYWAGVRERNPKDARGFHTLDSYEAEFPSWRDDLHQHDALVKARNAATHAARHNDSRFGELVNRLLRR